MVIERYYRPLAEEIVSNLKEGTILDLGTGPGYLLLEIAKQSPSAKVVGIDLSRKLIHMAQANASRAGFANRLEFEVGNASKLRFPDDLFDMVISTGMFHSLRHPLDVLREMYRVLKKGGEAWIYDPAQIASKIDVSKWKASLTLYDRFSLWLFTVLGLCKPSIKTYSRSQVIHMIETTNFREYGVEEADGEMKIRLIK